MEPSRSSPIIARTTSSVDSFVTAPFEAGIRHLKVAFCDGTQKTLINLAKERIIRRPDEGQEYKNLTLKGRVKHLLLGIGETVGYCTLLLPYFLIVLEKISNCKIIIKGCEEKITHCKEGGTDKSWDNNLIRTTVERYGREHPIFTPKDQPDMYKHNEPTIRRNPFTKEGKDDPFYKGASWNKNGEKK